MPGQSVLAAVSGGPDSVALLLVLAELRKRLRLKLLAAHVNHQLRGDDSERDQHFVEELCLRHNVELFLMRATLRNRQGNLEAVARSVRYDFFAGVASEHGATVTTGHTLDDQAETFLMRLFKGAGPAGLSGIRRRRTYQTERRRQIVIVRPLLEVTRSEILEYLEQTGESFRHDKMNQDQRFDRNWIRHQLLPQVKRRLNPSVSRTLSETAGLLSEMDAHLETRAKEFLQHWRKGNGESWALPWSELKKQSLAVQKQVIRKSLHELAPGARFRHVHVKQVLQLFDRTSGAEIHLPGGLKALREFECLRFAGRRDSVPPFSYRLECPGRVRIVEAGKSIAIGSPPEQRTANCFKLPAGLAQLTVRNRRPGDRFERNGAGRAGPLKKLFIEAKVPRSRRETVLILEADGNIVWVEGFGIAPAFRAESDGPGDEFEIRVESETFHD